MLFCHKQMRIEIEKKPNKMLRQKTSRLFSLSTQEAIIRGKILTEKQLIILFSLQLILMNYVNVKVIVSFINLYKCNLFKICVINTGKIGYCWGQMQKISSILWFSGLVFYKETKTFLSIITNTLPSNAWFQSHSWYVRIFSKAILCA